ncbi:hypothetical protein THAOC_36358 [Thalassiosira oceanica]|uniref:RING-type domain-containing protein n=1 Tax=Thalassiosira oceanica TaxID=159749 RepID=K0REQ1_THAOC|nr:hypothetical protein THAOC_36358 [Thalassiosira oceanica]|eukprot:EJK45052.1 hypothetical protein THAOC_36358 [Thalassiosira oceanica]
MAAENSHGADAVGTDQTCAICLEDPTDPLHLPCGHSFCDGCLNEWRSRYGEEEETKRKCPICRARIPPSKEMVATLHAYRAEKQLCEDNNDTSSLRYNDACDLLKEAEERVGSDWDGVTVLEDNNDKPPVVMPDYIAKAIWKGDIKAFVKWINANRREDRANAALTIDTMSIPALCAATTCGQLASMTHLLQLGANVDGRTIFGGTAISFAFEGKLKDVNNIVRLLLSWGASFFPGRDCSREGCIFVARKCGHHEVARLLESELGGRRCEVVGLSERPELNGKTCVADEYLPASNQYRVTLETETREALLLGPSNLQRRDRTPEDCGYYLEFKNGRAVRHDFDSSEECKAFVAALNGGGARPVVTEEAEARAERAAAELLAELGLDNSPNSAAAASDGQVKKSKKKKGGKKKNKKKSK